MRPTRFLCIVLIVGATYALGSQLAFTWFNATGLNGTFFPPAGVSMAALIVLRRGEWPAALIGVAAAELALDLANSITLAASIGYAVANVVQPIAGALALGSRRPRLDIARLADLTAFLVATVVFAPLVGATLGAATNAVMQEGDGFLEFVAHWWVGDGLGVLVVGGTIVALWSHASDITRRPLESAAMIGATGLFTILAFWMHWYALLYLPFVMLFLIAVRLRTSGVALAGAVTAFIAAEATARGNRLWTEMDVSDETGLLYLQLALGVIIASALVVAAGLSERELSTAAYALAEASRREADHGRRRAELLGHLAEDLAHASDDHQIAASLAERQLHDAWPHGIKFPSIGDGVHDLSDAIALVPNEVTDDPSVLEPARRMTLDALQRVQLVAEERRARERAELLERHSANLAAAVTPLDVARVTVNDVSSLGADYTAVWAREDTSMVVLATHRSRPGVGATPSSVRLEDDLPVTDCVRQGRILAFGTHAELVSCYPVLDRPGVRFDVSDTVVAVPLTAANGAVIGALVLADRSAHWFSDTRRQLVTGLAGQSGLALDRAALRSFAAQAAADADLLIRIGDLLDKATTVNDRAQCVADELVRLGAKTAEVELADGRVVLAHSDLGDGRAEGELTTFPLYARGQLVGRVHLRDGGLVDERRPLVRGITTRAALALDNAQLYEGERDASHRLQLGLLGVSTPTVDDCRIATAYRPGTSSLEVGGDWHDAFCLPNGSLGLVVGDVVGHGLDAAAAMAQLRGAVRALAAVSSPAELLVRLDSFVDSLPAAFMTTLVYVELDPATGELRYTCAGHPPPLIVSGEGTSRLLWEGRSPPLGSEFEADRVEAVSHLDDGERLVLYTDGLVERRSEAIDIGLERLVELSQHDVATPEFVDRICDDLVAGETGDDVCVLSVALIRAHTFARFCPARAEVLAGLRRDLRSWLGSMGCTEPENADIVLATSEAAANSVEHGVSEQAQGIAVVGHVEHGVVSIVVRDHGHWRDPGPPADRGRGFPIMRQLMDSVSVEAGEGGTVVRMERAVTPA